MSTRLGALQEALKRQSWNMVRNLKIYRAKNCCEICGRYISNYKGLLGHHLISLRDGGVDADDNIMIVCPRCIKIVHALQALEKAGQYIEIKTCYMSDWELLKYSVKKNLKYIRWGGMV